MALSYRFPLSALLLGSLALVILSQAVTVARQPQVPLSVYFIAALGLLAFVTAGHMIVRGDMSLWQSRFVQRVSDVFRIGPGQLVLLLLAPVLAYLARLAAGDGLRALHAPAAMAAWLLAVVAVIAGSVAREADARPRLERDELLLTLILFISAFALRGTFLNEIPTTLSGDEGSAGLAAVRFLEGKANNLFAIGWFSFPSLYFALQSVGIWLLDQTAEGLRISSALAGAATVPALYWFARGLFDRTMGMLAALYLLAAHYHIHFSRIGLQNIWDGFFVVVALGGLWYGWQRGWRGGFILCGVALGLGQYFYVSMRVVPLLLLLWAGAAWLAEGAVRSAAPERPRFRQRLPDLLLAAFIALVIFLPLGLFFLQHPAEFQAPMQRVTIFDGWLELESRRTGDEPWRIILRQMWETGLGFTHRPLRNWYNPGTPLLLALPAALFLAGLFWALVMLDLRYLLILLAILAVVLLGGFSQDAPASQRFVLAAPMAAVLVALPLGQTAAWLGRFWPRTRSLIAAGALLLMAIVAARDIYYYFAEVYDAYVLGGPNTLAATAIADYLREQEEPAQVYFFGLPRMGYSSLSTIPYLAPHMTGQDVGEPLTAPPDWRIQGATLFIFLPERLDELRAVEAAFPGGSLRRFETADGGPALPLFVVYEVSR